MVLANIASSLYWPFLALYLEELGASVAEIGFFFTAQILFAVIFRILGGWASDQWGRLRILAWGGLLGWLATATYGFTPTWEFTLMAAALSEAGGALVETSFQAYIAENTPENRLGTVFGISNGLLGLCLVIGPVTTSILLRFVELRTIMLLATVLFGGAAILRWMVARGARGERPVQPIIGLRRHISTFMIFFIGNALLLWVFLIDGLVDSNLQLVQPFFPDYATDVGGLTETEYGLLFTLMPLVSMIAFVPGGMFTDRWGERWGLVVGCLMFALVWAVVYFLPPTIFVLGVMFALAGIAQAFTGPAFSSLISKSVPKESLGISWGLFATTLGMLSTPAPYLGGYLYRHDPTAPFALAGILAITAAVLAFLKLRGRQPQPQPVAGL
jgi:MFS family permease